LNRTEYNLTDIPIERLRARRSAKWTSYPPDVLPAFVAEMDFPLADPVKDALRAAIERDDTGYANPPASDLAAAFSGFAGRRFDWTVDPGMVAATSDVVGGLRWLLASIAEPGDRIIVTPPVYYPFFSIIPEVGCEVAEAPLTPAGTLDLDLIEDRFAAGARAMILCSPHNPAGTVPTRDELARLAGIAARHDAWILADEIHAPLTLPGAVHTPFLDVSEEARQHGICVTSASKTFNIAGLGCALFVTASPRALKVVLDLPRGAGHAGHLGVIASQAAFEAGDDWLDQVITRLDGNRRLLADLVDRHLPGAHYRPPSAGYLAWIDARELGLGDDPSEAILERAHVAVSSGPGFGTGGSGHFRINIGTTPELIAHAIESIGDIL
jgi:cystathionine beta-lyase